MKIELDAGDDCIEIIKTKRCSIHGCKGLVERMMCKLGLCKEHYEEAND